MRLAKLSLAAIVALGVSAFAEVSDVQFGGDAKLYYGTNDVDPNDLFDKANSYGQAALDLYMGADVGDNAKLKLGVTGVGTLGLENNLVSSTWVDGLNGWWVSEAWLATPVVGNTTLKVGRQELDTPLAFSEKWSIAANTFDAAVLINGDLPKTTLIAAYVGRGNGSWTGKVVKVDEDAGSGAFDTYGTAIVEGIDGINSKDGVAASLGIKAKGAYAVSAITEIIPSTVAQVWYYNVQSIAEAWWLQADINLNALVPKLYLGVQYTLVSLDDIDVINSALNSNFDDSMAWAVKIGYNISAVKTNFAYSEVDEDGLVKISNSATGLIKAQSKLYTEALINYGYVGAPGAKSFHADFGYDVEDLANFNAYFTSVKDANNNTDMMELALTASKQIGNLNTTFAYIYTDADDQNGGDSYNTLQLLLTYQF
jgi:hypothetical protein